MYSVLDVVKRIVVYGISFIHIHIHIVYGKKASVAGVGAWSARD